MVWNRRYVDVCANFLIIGNSHFSCNYQLKCKWRLWKWMYVRTQIVIIKVNGAKTRRVCMLKLMPHCKFTVCSTIITCICTLNIVLDWFELRMTTTNERKTVREMQDAATMERIAIVYPKNTFLLFSWYPWNIYIRICEMLWLEWILSKTFEIVFDV